MLTTSLVMSRQEKYTINMERKVLDNKRLKKICNREGEIIISVNSGTFKAKTFLIASLVKAVVEEVAFISILMMEEVTTNIVSKCTPISIKIVMSLSLMMKIMSNSKNGERLCS